jgi:hypothetical protein
MTYYPKSGPNVSVAHKDWREDAFINSHDGDVWAKQKNFPWVDHDNGLSSDLVWCNGHQTPSYIWFPPGHSFRDYPWSHLSTLVYDGRHLRSGYEELRDARHCGRKVEFEVKFVGPISDADLRVAFAHLSAHARVLWGEHWQQYIRVKCLTSLHGGDAYALRVLAAAHQMGFDTILLAEGRCRLKSYAGHTELTWVRHSVNPHIRRNR